MHIHEFNAKTKTYFVNDSTVKSMENLIPDCEKIANLFQYKNPTTIDEAI